MSYIAMEKALPTGQTVNVWKLKSLMMQFTRDTPGGRISTLAVDLGGWSTEADYLAGYDPILSLGSHVNADDIATYDEFLANPFGSFLYATWQQMKAKDPQWLTSSFVV